MGMRQGTFLKEDTTYFKGIAILLIVIHNYFHLAKAYNLQNEIDFQVSNVYSFMNLFSRLDLKDWIGGSFGFLGHYGVQIFIFFSAYGLSIQYSKWKQSQVKFIFKRLIKIYFLLAFGILFWVISKKFIGATDNFTGVIVQLFYLMTSVGCLLREYVYSMFSGPYWFFAFIIQLYVLFPVIYQLTIRMGKQNKWIPLTGALLLLYLLYYVSDLQKFSLFGCILGHLPEVILGIIMAHNQIKTFPVSIFLSAIAVFVLSQFFSFLFPLSFIAMTIILLNLINWMKQYSHVLLSKFIFFTGAISMMLFVFNGTFRYYPLFVKAGNDRAVLFIPFVLILYLISYIAYRAFNYVLKRFNF